MIITKRRLDRRTLLRGAGAALALPWLEAMTPALSAAPAAPRRLGFVYMPMGAHMPEWTPLHEGEKLGELSSTLKSLEPVRDYLTVVENMELKNAYPGTHATSNAAFLSAATAKWTESSDYYLGTTVDQVAAQQIGQGTRLPSMEMAMDLLTVVGQCDNGYACVYQNNLSWSSPTTPLPAEAHPRLAFERLFGEGGPAAERARELRKEASLLDWVRDDMARLNRDLGVADRRRVAEYLDTVREVERRIERAEAGVKENPMPDLERPVGVPASYAEHARLMFDLQVLAMQGDVTRVMTFQLARETSNRSYPEVGVSESHHPLTHNGGNPEKLAKVARINAFHVSLFSYYLGKLKATAEGDGNLLEHSLILYGSGMSDADIHDHTNLPVLVAGGKARGGRYVEAKPNTPLANLHLTLLDRVGVRLDRFADSRGKIDQIVTL